MAAKIIDIADAVVVSLNAGSFTETFTASRTYRPPQDTEDLTNEANPRVFVLPAGRTPVRQPTSRVKSRWIDYALDVAIQKKVNADQNSDSDALMLLVEEIEDHLMNAGTMSNCAWQGSTNEAIYNPAMFDEIQIFQSVVRTIYRQER